MMPPVVYDPLNAAELIHIASRLDNRGECSRFEANRLLATIRELQGDIEARDAHQAHEADR